MNKMKNACIVGYGSIASSHAMALDECENARFYAVCDINPERIMEAKKNRNLICYSDFKLMLADKNVDTVHICTPHFLHAPMTIQAMKIGKDVVLEKPAAINQKEFEKILKVQHETGKKICLMLQNRTNACIVKLKEICESHIYGNMTGVFGSMTWNRQPEYYTNSDWKGKYATEGGSLLINQAIHLLDLIGFMGNGIKSIHSTMSTLLLNDIIETEDTASMALELNNGARGCLFATNTYTADEPFRLEVRFENALLRYADYKLYLITDDTKVIAQDEINKTTKSYWGCGHNKVINQFYKALSNGGDFISVNDGINTMESVFSIYENRNNR